MTGRPKKKRPDDNDVGYKRPPKSTRFKPGTSGNPKGRPKGSRNFETDLKATLKQPVIIRNGGQFRKVSTQQAALARLREKALGGDARAMDSLIKLARTLDDEGPTEGESTRSKEDQAIIETFIARIRSGAAYLPTPQAEDHKPDPAQPKGGHIKRYRPKGERND
jgi:hypothetical protein